ncbi:unnamed protein product [Microthlaspi erraticum]|uniref:Retrotransposon gag domain-containing protein n=1 Tax=Microthlaspi erraticum TaxID=1685480 RepID=A0A6D2KHN9_9BRAS|nr:unnamed protein product [Microthlaspi erraticum]
MVENLGGYKIRIPPFHGNNPDEYMDWEKKCEFNFNLHNISNINRVKLAVSEFNDYALRWWEQVVTAREIGGALERSHYVQVPWRAQPRSKIVEMQNCVGLSLCYTKAVLAEQQLKRKTTHGADQRRPMPETPNRLSHQKSQEEPSYSQDKDKNKSSQLCPRARLSASVSRLWTLCHECRNKKI